MSYKVRTIDLGTFSFMRDEWNRLVFEMRRPSVFCTWEWMHLWWKHFGQSYRPLILLIEDANEIVGILPLAVRTMVIEDGVLPVRTLTLWSSIDLHTDHLDIIACPEKTRPCAEAIMSFLRKNCTNWDVVHLSHIDEDSELLCFVRERNSSNDADIQMVSVSPYFALPDNFDSYTKRFSRKHRYNLRRQRARLFEDGVTFELTDGADETLVVLRELFELHMLRKQSKGLKSSFAIPVVTDFQMDLAQLLQATGWLRLFSLRHKGKAIAVNYGFVLANRFSYYQSGLDPAWENSSAGSTLLLEMIRTVCEGGCEEFDFLRGDEPYKWLWTEDSRSLYNVNMYTKTLRSTLFRTTYKARSFLKGIIRPDGN